MITLEEAKSLHVALQYDSVLSPLALLTAPINQLSATLDQAIALLGGAKLIVFPWEHARPFQRQWEDVPAIQSARGPGTSRCEPWLWGYFITYRGIDCFATGLVREVLVSRIRDLRTAYAPAEGVVVIDVVG